MLSSRFRHQKNNSDMFDPDEMRIFKHSDGSFSINNGPLSKYGIKAPSARTNVFHRSRIIKPQVNKNQQFSVTQNPRCGRLLPLRKPESVETRSLDGDSDGEERKIHIVFYKPEEVVQLNLLREPEGLDDDPSPRRNMFLRQKEQKVIENNDNEEKNNNFVPEEKKINNVIEKDIEADLEENNDENNTKVEEEEEEIKENLEEANEENTEPEEKVIEDPKIEEKSAEKPNQKKFSEMYLEAMEFAKRKEQRKKELLETLKKNEERRKNSGK